MREVSQLIDVEEPAWPELRETLGAGTVPVAELLGVARNTGRQFDGAVPGFLGAL
ncbi:hypothetical protein ACFYZ9_26075 [Streptomyces sp. NPDC001691]|uniref:hypothetical protein n=1 Tax=Streptomyces sp. NPDC001691 TaxID=3364600 RepID=UPI003678AB35